MVTRDITIINKLGLHARAASKFVTLAARFTAEVRLVRGAREVNGKSIMGVMMLAAGKGTQLKLITDGADEDDAANALETLIRQRFGEEE